MQRVRTILFLLAPWLAVRAEQPLALPDWLAMLPGASSVARTASSSSLDLSYLDSLSLTEATSRFEQQMEKAGVRFSGSFDGIGNSISASTESVSCIVHIADADSGSRVRIGCAPAVARSNSPVIAPGVQPASAAPVASVPAAAHPVIAPPAVPAPAVTHAVAAAPAVSAPAVAVRSVVTAPVVTAPVTAATVVAPPVVPHAAPVTPVVAVPKQAAAARAIPMGTEIEGWSQARWGMTQNEVLRAFPGEAKILTGDVSGRRFGSRGIATVGINQTEIGGIPVRMLFFFDDAARLDGIRFVADLDSPLDDQFTKMQSALEGVYKAPTLRAAAMGKSAFNSAWLLPNSVIELAYVRSELLNLCIDRRHSQTAETVRASWPGFTEVRGTSQVSGLSRPQSEKSGR